MSDKGAQTELGIFEKRRYQAKFITLLQYFKLFVSEDSIALTYADRNGSLSMSTPLEPTVY